LPTVIDVWGEDILNFKRQFKYAIPCLIEKINCIAEYSNEGSNTTTFDSELEKLGQFVTEIRTYIQH